MYSTRVVYSMNESGQSLTVLTGLYIVNKSFIVRNDREITVTTAAWDQAVGSAARPKI